MRRYPDSQHCFGDRAFVAAGPGLWNGLPPRLRDADLKGISTTAALRCASLRCAALRCAALR